MRWEKEKEQEVEEDKEQFVREFLSPCLTMATRGAVVEANYQETSADEVVVVKWRSGSETVVNVSCDSEMGILRDVVKALEDF